MTDIQQLVRLLQSDQPSIRRNACEQLIVLPVLTQDAINALIIVTHDADVSVAKSAKRAIELHQFDIDLSQDAIDILLWDRAKLLLAEYDGAATEIFVVGLPLSQLPVVMATLSELPMLEIMNFGDESFEPPEPFDTIWHSRLESAPSHNCQHSLRSANWTARHLQIYLWVDVETATLEVELVFWNDLTFPQNINAVEYEQRLKALVSLAEACRTGVPGARCILSPEYNGPTGELLERYDEYVIVW